MLVGTPALVKCYHTFSENFLDVLTTKPNGSITDKLNKFFTRSDYEGWWNFMDCAYFLEAHDNQASRVNLFNPAQVATVVGTPTFTAGSGWSGGTTANYLDTGIDAATAAKYKQNNAHISVFSNTDVNQNASDLGINGSFTGYIRSREPSFAAIFASVNNSGTSHIRAPFAANGWAVTAIGHSLVQRIGSGTTFNTDANVFKNGVKATSGVISGGSTAPASANFTILRAETAGTKQLGFASFGAAMADPMAVNFSAAVAELMA